MKKIIIGSLIMFNAFGFSQITMTNISNEKAKTILPYDGLINFLGSDYAKYKGQELYLIPLKEGLRNFGYEGFLIDYNKSSLEKSNQFRCCGIMYSKYEDLAEQYFIVEDIIEPTSINRDVFLKLKTKKTGETVYYKYDIKYTHKFPFLVVDYYNKQKAFFVGKEILVRDWKKTGNANEKKNIEVDSGNEITIEKGKYLKCLDLTIEKKYYQLSLLLQNEKGEKFAFPLYARDLNIKRILTKDEAENYRLKFGEENWKNILDETVKVGFTEEMTKVCLGEPDKINHTSNGDQWIYGSKFFYFMNGKMTSFN
jgi:hypothetical protein